MREALVMLTHEQESPGPLFELAGLNFLGGREIGWEGGGVRFDFLDLPGIFAVEKPIRRKCTIEVKAEQVSVPTYPECACLDGVAPHSPVKQRILDVPHGRKALCIKLKRRRWEC
jgi:hypothetical protein